MHGNAPHAGRESGDLSPEHRRDLRREGSTVAARARELLPDSFVVGAELVEGSDGVRAAVAVQPPTGSVVSTDFALDEEADHATLAQQLAAGAALQVKNAHSHDDPTGS